MADDVIDGRNVDAELCAKLGSGRERCLATWVSLPNIDCRRRCFAMPPSCQTHVKDGFLKRGQMDMASGRPVPLAPIPESPPTPLARPAPSTPQPYITTARLKRRCEPSHRQTIWQVPAVLHSRLSGNGLTMTSNSLLKRGSTPSPTRRRQSYASSAWARPEPKTRRLSFVRYRNPFCGC